MFGKLTHVISISAAKSLLKLDDKSELSTGKRLISILAGAYMLQRGVRILTKHPFLGIQETLLGGLLLYNAATGMEKTASKKPKEVSEVRRNQIQGNDPESGVPAFV